MTIYDISLTISPTLPTWPGDPALELELIESMDQGAHANVTRISAAEKKLVGAEAKKLAEFMGMPLELKHGAIAR